MSYSCFIVKGRIHYFFLFVTCREGLETEIHVAWSSIKTAEKYLVQCSPVEPKKVEKKADSTESREEAEKSTDDVKSDDKKEEEVEKVKVNF